MDYESLKFSISEGGWVAALFALGITAVLTLIFALGIQTLAKFAERLTARTQAGWDDYLPVILANTRTWVVAIWLFDVVAKAVGLHENLIGGMKTVTVLATTFQVIIWVLKCVRHWRDHKLSHMVKTEQHAPIGLLSAVAETILVVIFVMVGLSNLGVDIGALIAGLGIGGIAVALAAQNILGDLFASFSIIFDKPFGIGDAIKVGDYSGTVQNIGLKTTRLKSQTGEQLVLSNKDLLESRIQNFKRMDERRVVQKLRVPFNSQLDKIKMIPSWVQETLEAQSDARFDSCALTELTEWAFSFECVYWVQTPDWKTHLKVQEKFFYDVIGKMREQKISLAVPAQYQWIDELDTMGEPIKKEPSTRRDPEEIADNGRMGRA